MTSAVRHLLCTAFLIPHKELNPVPVARTLSPASFTIFLFLRDARGTCRKQTTRLASRGAIMRSVEWGVQFRVFVYSLGVPFLFGDVTRTRVDTDTPLRCLYGFFLTYELFSKSEASPNWKRPPPLLNPFSRFRVPVFVSTLFFCFFPFCRLTAASSDSQNWALHVRFGSFPSPLGRTAHLFRGDLARKKKTHERQK